MIMEKYRFFEVFNKGAQQRSEINSTRPYKARQAPGLRKTVYWENKPSPALKLEYDTFKTRKKIYKNKLLWCNCKFSYNFITVFIGYGLKTGQGFYPGPNYLYTCRYKMVLNA
jgi:hypothetical protein